MSDRESHLITAQTLADRLSQPDRPRVLDCRFELTQPDAGEQAFHAGHIPGALYAHLDRDLSGPGSPQQGGRHPLPDPSALEATLRRWGIEQDTPVVVYDDGPAMFAARAWWLCRWAGVTRVQVLDGGWQAWRERGEAIETGPPAPVEASRLTVDCPPDWIVSLRDLEADPDRWCLLDARAPERYTGQHEPIDHRAGHIPGAINAPFTDNLASSGRFHTDRALRQRYAPVAGQAALACYCGSGVTACHTLLALTLAGRPDARLYPGSWSEWSRDEHRPVETGMTKDPL